MFCSEGGGFSRGGGLFQRGFSRGNTVYADDFIRPFGFQPGYNIGAGGALFEFIHYIKSQLKQNYPKSPNNIISAQSYL